MCNFDVPSAASSSNYLLAFYNIYYLGNYILITFKLYGCIMLYNSPIFHYFLINELILNLNQSYKVYERGLQYSMKCDILHNSENTDEMAINKNIFCSCVRSVLRSVCGI